MELRSLAQQTVVITGASSGIGAASAVSLAAAGANVVLGARRAERLDSLIEEIGPDRAIAVGTDVRDATAVEQLVSAGVERFGRVDSIVISAGIGLYGGIEDYPDDEIKRMVDTNVLGTIWAVRAALPEFRRNAAGDIVIIASVAGLQAGGHEAVYASTKFAQVGLASAIDRQLRPEGIRVTALCPAGTSTEFAIGAGREVGDPVLDEMLLPDDIAFQVVTVLQQPRRMRTTLWSSWSMDHGN